MNKTELHHPFVDDIRKVLSELNLYVNNKLSLEFYSTEYKDTTNFNFKLIETGRFTEDILQDNRVIFGFNYKVTTTQIKNSTINIISFTIDDIINNKIKPDFIRYAITHLSGLADENKPLG